MKHSIFILTSPTQSILETEILFSVATARAEGIDFLLLKTDKLKREKIFPNATKILRGLKKQGRITLFIETDELQGNSTEAEYLRNKHPQITEASDECEAALLVKI